MIAQSIGVFHADGWVHKSVCSQAVVFFKERTKETLILDSPYLVDFGYSRPEQGRTYAYYHQTTDSTTLFLHHEMDRNTFRARRVLEHAKDADPCEALKREERYCP
jgi:hypothetical protein